MLYTTAATLLAACILGVWGQECDTTFPDGSDCPQDASIHRMADPDDCTSYWWCSAPTNNCPTHRQCERSYLFDPNLGLCADNRRVDCGDRPCLDPIHCPSEHPTTPSPPPTTTPCDHTFDCKAAGDGWFGDEYNCRKYWHCYEGQGEHFTCRDNLLYNAELIQCDYPERVDCGDRPICGPCDEDCHTQPPPPTTIPPERCQHECTADGLFAEECCGSAFCQCYGGHGYVLHCETGLVFNDASKTCDYPANVACCNA